MTMPRALISGATGFVGGHLARGLMQRGWEVHAIVRDTSSGALPEGLVAHSHDGGTGGMNDIVKAAAPDVVFHLASLFLAEHSPDDLEPLIRSNVLFGSQLLEAMCAAGVTRLVNTGTSWQHYENSDYNPVCLYAATKQAFEAIAEYYVQTCSMNVVTLKLFDTYGPGDRRKKLFALLRQISHDGTELNMSGGEQLIDVVYIDDVVEAYVAAAELLLGGDVAGSAEYAVSSGAPMSLRALVQRYSAVTGRRLNINWGARPYRPREVMVPWDKGQPTPGWEPKVGLDDGIRRLEEALRTEE